MESAAAEDAKFSLEHMAINGMKVTGETLNPHFMWVQEQMHPRLKCFLNWEHVATTGLVFTTMICTLWILNHFYVVYTVSVTFLAFLMISIMLWLLHGVYKMCIYVYNSDESQSLQHPFKPYFEMQTTFSITEIEIHRAVDVVIKYVDIFFKRFKEIIFVDNLLESAVVWSILLIISVYWHYCGTTMTVVTPLNWIVICLFSISLPFGYIEHKTTIDQFCIHVLKRIQHGKKLKCNIHEDSSTMDEGYKASLSEKLIKKFSSVLFLIQLERKMIYYLLAPMVITAVSSLLLCLFEVEIPHIESVTGKRSFLNQVFVKFGWGWTLSLLLLFQFCLIFIYRNRWNYLCNIAIKTFFTTLFFYIWCQIIFPLIEEFYGECKQNESIVAVSKRQCLKNPEHTYMSHFDISGHTYLMAYCILIIMREAEQVEDLLNALQVPGKDKNLVPHAPQFAVHFVAISFILITILSLLWDFMMIITMTYYHSCIENFLGIVLAILMFNIVYEKILPYFFSLIKS